LLELAGVDALFQIEETGGPPAQAAPPDRATVDAERSDLDQQARSS
jgi:hypothetical protein